jgi:hypothetical protein
LVRYVFNIRFTPLRANGCIHPGDPRCPIRFLSAKRTPEGQANRTPQVEERRLFIKIV